METVTTTLRLLAGLLFILLMLVVSAPVLVLLLPARRLRILIGNLVGKMIGRTCLWLAKAEVPADAPALADRHFPAIYISNHTSILDIFLGIWIAPYGTCGVAKKQVVWYPFFGLIYLLAGHLRIDRSHHGRAVEALAGMALMMRKKRLGVWLWPEGTRARDGRLQGFKKGFAHLALATRLPIVPVVIGGAHKGWEKNAIRFKPVKLMVKVLDPIDTRAWTLENLETHVADVHALIAAALPEDQRPVAAGSAEELTTAGGAAAEPSARSRPAHAELASRAGVA